FHETIKLVLEDVNRNKHTSLKIITGEDLLYSVGRLSMMITHADFAPVDETSALPLNWTSHKYILKRIQRVMGDLMSEQEIKFAAKQIVNNVDKAHFRLSAVERLEHPSVMVKRTLLSDLLAPAFTTIAAWLEGLTDKDLLTLAKPDKIFLAL